MNQEQIIREDTNKKDIELAKRLVWLMEQWIRVPILNKRIGLDPILGLIPVVGDVITGLISLLIVVGLVRNGAPITLILRMLFNVFIDVVIGGIPVFGAIWDFYFQSNLKNLRLLLEYHSSTSEISNVSFEASQPAY
jgi:hypothetical protein